MHAGPPTRQNPDDAGQKKTQKKKKNLNIYPLPLLLYNLNYSFESFFIIVVIFESV